MHTFLSGHILWVQRVSLLGFNHYRQKKWSRGLLSSHVQLPYRTPLLKSGLVLFGFSTCSNRWPVCVVVQWDVQRHYQPPTRSSEAPPLFLPPLTKTSSVKRWNIGHWKCQQFSVERWRGFCRLHAHWLYVLLPSLTMSRRLLNYIYGSRRHAAPAWPPPGHSGPSAITLAQWAESRFCSTSPNYTSTPTPWSNNTTNSFSHGLKYILLRGFCLSSRRYVWVFSFFLYFFAFYLSPFWSQWLKQRQ